MSFEEGCPLDPGQSDDVFNIIVSSDDKATIDDLTLFLDEIEKIMLQEEIQPENIDNGELEINVANVDHS